MLLLKVISLLSSDKKEGTILFYQLSRYSAILGNCRQIFFQVKNERFDWLCSVLKSCNKSKGIYQIISNMSLKLSPILKTKQKTHRYKWDIKRSDYLTKVAAEKKISHFHFHHI